MARSNSTALRELERLYSVYGEDAGAGKLSLLDRLERARLPGPEAVESFHEILLFLRAYPDSPELLERVDRLLGSFARRTDLKRHREELENSGIAGTPIYYRFFWFTALWLAERWPQLLSIDWPEFETHETLAQRMPFLMPYAERLSLDEVAPGARNWVEWLKGPEETDAAFVIRRFAALRMSSFARERLYEELDIPYRLEPGPETPSRTRAHYRQAPVVFHRQPLERSRSAFRPALERPLAAVHELTPRQARPLLHLSREAMVARARDLDVFIHADPRDVRLVDCEHGLQFACFGTVPERRQNLDAVYGVLILKNGVPLGYFLTSALFGSAEVAYNVFATYRGGEAAHIYGRALAVVRHLFRVDSFVVDPYQLGHENDEGLESGAWWFYYKLGFRPRDPGVLKLVRRELARLRRNPRYRSSIATLRKLSAVEMYLSLGRPRPDVLGLFSRENVGYHVSQYLAGRFGADRETAVRVCSEEAARLLGVRSFSRFSPGEKQAWKRWAPIVMAIPGIRRWGQSSRRRLVDVIRAKGGRRESDFVHLFDQHTTLRRAVFRLSETEA